MRRKGKKILDSNHGKQEQNVVYSQNTQALCVISTKFSKAYKLQYHIYLFIYFERYHHIYLTWKNYARRPSNPIAATSCLFIYLFWKISSHLFNKETPEDHLSRLLFSIAGINNQLQLWRNKLLTGLENSIEASFMLHGMM